MPKSEVAFVYLALSLLILSLSGCFSPRFTGVHTAKDRNVIAVSLTRKDDTFTSHSYINIPCSNRPCSQFDYNAPTVDFISKRIGNIQFNVILSKRFENIRTKKEVSEGLRRLYLFTLEQLQTNYVNTFAEFALPLTIELTIVAENEEVTHLFKDVTQNEAVFRFFAPVKENDLTTYSNSSIRTLFNLTSTLAHEITHLADGYRWSNNDYPQHTISTLEYRAAIFRLYYRIHLAMMLKKHFAIEVELELTPLHKAACNNSQKARLSADNISSLYNLDEWQTGYELGTLKVIEIIDTCQITSKILDAVYKKLKRSKEFERLKYGY